MERTPEQPKHIPQRVTALALFGLITLFGSSVHAAQPSLYVTPFNDDILAETIQNRVKFHDIADAYCGDPTIDGYAGLFEYPLNIPYKNSLGRIAYLKEKDPHSDKQVFKLCIVDLVDKKDNFNRDHNSIADVDWKIFNQIKPNKNLDISFIPPEVTKPMTTTTVYERSAESPQPKMHHGYRTVQAR